MRTALRPAMPGGNHERNARQPSPTRGFRRRSGQERGRQYRAAGGRDRGRAGRHPAFRDRLRQRRLDRQDRVRIDPADGEPPVAAACHASVFVRAIGGGAHRRGACARAGRGHARRRRPERSGLHPGAARGAGGRARRASGSSPASASGARRPASSGCSRASPTACAARCCATARATPAAASRRSAATCSWRCPISTGCTGSCRRWCGARATTSAMSTWSIGRAAQGVSNYGMWDRLWVGILDLAGVWWLIRRKKRVPQVSEVKRDAH